MEYLIALEQQATALIAGVDDEKVEAKLVESKAWLDKALALSDIYPEYEEPEHKNTEISDLNEFSEALLSHIENDGKTSSRYGLCLTQAYVAAEEAKIWAIYAEATKGDTAKVAEEPENEGKIPVTVPSNESERANPETGNAEESQNRSIPEGEVLDGHEDELPTNEPDEPARGPKGDNSGMAAESNQAGKKKK